MVLSNLYLIGLLSVAIQLNLATKIITHKGACTVTTDEGRIDLTPLGNTNGTARFQNLEGNDGTYYAFIYEWNPCKDFTDSRQDHGKECTNVAVCQTSAYGETSYLNYGKTDTASWSVSSDGNVMLNYDDGSESKTFKSTIKLICDKRSSTDKITVLPQKMGPQVSFELRSKHCCAVPASKPAGGSTGLSTGSILCIVLLVVVSLYILGGLIFTVGYKKSEGTQRIPNVEFWTSMPGLVKDGVKFTVCCDWKQQDGRGSSSKYDQI